MAEGEGFEPPVRLLALLISSQVHSTKLCHPSEKCVDKFTKKLSDIQEFVFIAIKACKIVICISKCTSLGVFSRVMLHLHIHATPDFKPQFYIITSLAIEEAALPQYG